MEPYEHSLPHAHIALRHSVDMGDVSEEDDDMLVPPVVPDTYNLHRYTPKENKTQSNYIHTWLRSRRMKKLATASTTNGQTLRQQRTL